MDEISNIIEKTIAEHHEIRDNIKLTGDSLTDVEALFILRNAYSGLAQSPDDELEAKQEQLLQALNSLEQGLRHHFSFEEKELPSLFGQQFMKAIVFEHEEIVGQIQKAKEAVAGIKLEGLDQPELLSRKTSIQETVNRLLQIIEAHANNEELVLKMMKKALESTAGS